MPTNWRYSLLPSRIAPSIKFKQINPRLGAFDPQTEQFFARELLRNGIGFERQLVSQFENIQIFHAVHGLHLRRHDHVSRTRLSRPHEHDHGLSIPRSRQLLARRQRLGTAEHLIEVDDFGLPRQLSHRLLMGVGQKRRRFFPRQLLILGDKFLVRVHPPRRFS